MPFPVPRLLDEGAQYVARRLEPDGFRTMVAKIAMALIHMISIVFPHCSRSQLSMHCVLSAGKVSSVSFVTQPLGLSFSFVGSTGGIVLQMIIETPRLAA